MGLFPRYISKRKRWGQHHFRSKADLAIRLMIWRGEVQHEDYEAARKSMEPDTRERIGFLHLPSEIRMKIYELLVPRTHPIWNRSFAYGCSNCGPNIWRTQRSLSAQLLRTCKTIYFEYSEVMHRRASFAVLSPYTERKSETAPALCLWNRHIFDLSSRNRYALFIRHLDFLIDLVPKSFFPTTTVPNEEALCTYYRQVFEYLLVMQRIDLPYLRRVRVNIQIHVQGPAAIQCAHAFVILFRLDSRRRFHQKYHELDFVQHEPRRQLLVPLAKLKFLDRIDLCLYRCLWLKTPGSLISIQDACYRETYIYKSLKNLLIGLGTNFENLTLGRTYWTMFLNFGSDEEAVGQFFVQPTLKFEDRVSKLKLKNPRVPYSDTERLSPESVNSEEPESFDLDELESFDFEDLDSIDFEGRESLHIEEPETETLVNR